MISIVTKSKNRAHFLKHTLEGVAQQALPTGTTFRDMHLNVSTYPENKDDLDEVLKKYSNVFGSVTKWLLIDKLKPYDSQFNCPSALYNWLVGYFTPPEHPYILKFDPEFAFIDKHFVRKAYAIVQNKPNTFVMPLPFHMTGEHTYDSIEEIRRNYRDFIHPTHINESTAASCNVYYGSFFRREPFIELGGVDLRFLIGIGSEDDHFLHQWRRKYGVQAVKTLLDSHGAHLYHSDWGNGVLPEQWMWDYVHKNAHLKNQLANTFPNDGNFAATKPPANVHKTVWENEKITYDGKWEAPQ